jgi:hypothetical protein
MAFFGRDWWICLRLIENSRQPPELVVANAREQLTLMKVAAIAAEAPAPPTSSSPHSTSDDGSPLRSET